VGIRLIHAVISFTVNTFHTRRKTMKAMDGKKAPAGWKDPQALAEREEGRGPPGLKQKGRRPDDPGRRRLSLVCASVNTNPQNVP
jgi:hypothetical protein